MFVKLDKGRKQYYVCFMVNSKEKRVYQIVGDNIRKYRTEAGVNQTTLASKVNLSRTSIVNIEQGRQHPSIFLLTQIAESLSIEIVDLLPRKDQMRSNNFPMSGDTIIDVSVEDPSYKTITAFIEAANKS